MHYVYAYECKLLWKKRDRSLKGIGGSLNHNVVDGSMLAYPDEVKTFEVL